LDGESHKDDVDKPGDYFRSEFRQQVVYIDNVDDTFKRSREKERGDREMSSAMMLERVRGYQEQKSRESLRITEQVDAARKAPLPAARPVPPGAAFDFGRLALPLYDRVVSEEKRKERELQRRRGFLESLDQSIGKYMVEVHKKYSIPAACPALVLVGAPLGIMARASGIGMGVAYSLAFFILYWIFLIAGESLADRLIIPAWAAMWSPNIMLTGIGVWLIIKLVREQTFAWFAWLTRGIQWLERKLTVRKEGG
ncbi:MAG: LptF/LptG family permease, partial [Fibrobacterota bacterium]